LWILPEAVSDWMFTIVDGLICYRLCWPHRSERRRWACLPEGDGSEPPHTACSSRMPACPGCRRGCPESASPLCSPDIAFALSAKENGRAVSCPAVD